MEENLPPLWQCQKCGERFVTKNLWHSLGKYRFFKIEGYAPHFNRHLFRVYSEADLDQDVQRWMCESYEVGAQKHLKR